jgi:asparagine synthase (glutamine-hydrolysing)
MSAIFGMYYLDGRPAGRVTLELMAEMLAHRGQDGTGLWTSGSTGLGHRMMWTTPESLDERLPLSNKTGSLCITADARIDNRGELIKLLANDAPISHESSDSALILFAYEKWGERCLERLVGDFVFAIWDAQKKRLFCARDPLGVKHFYYFSSRSLFVFASEIKAIHCLHEVPCELNELSVADHLLPIYEDKVSTFYKDIVRLPAAHCLTASPESVVVRAYWTPDLGRELRLKSNDDYAEAFQEHFTEAVRCRLRSAFPIGSMLSGGLDSSSVTCTARKVLSEEGRLPIHTFSGIFPTLAEVDSRTDERRYIHAVTALEGIEPHYIEADRFSPLSDIDKIFWHMENALPAPNMYLDWAIFRAAQQQGVRVLFSGNDGDSVVSFGYEDFSELARRGWWRTLMREARALSKSSPSRAHTFRRLVWNEGFRPLVPESAKQIWRVAHARPRLPDTNNRLHNYCKTRPINPDFAARIGLTERFWSLSNKSFPPNSTAREYHWSAISSGMDSFLLESFEKAGAAFSVEVRFPFFDKRLVEFCLALPPGQKLQHGWTRSILRRAMRGILPPEIQWRKGKGSLGANIKLKLLEYERHTLDDVVLNNPGTIAKYVDVRALRTAYQAYIRNPLQSNDESFTLSLVVNLALWLRSTATQFRASPASSWVA